MVRGSKGMIIVDTNIILRYLLNDNEELNKRAVEIVYNNELEKSH